MTTTDQSPADNMRRPVPDQIAIVNIDDLREVLRGLHKLGYSARRMGKLARWKVYPLDLATSLLTRCPVREILVDTTRTVPRGITLTFDAPQWKIEPIVEYDPPVFDIYWRYHYYGWF